MTSAVSHSPTCSATDQGSVIVAAHSGTRIKFLGQSTYPLDEVLLSAFSLLGITEIPSGYDLKTLKEFIYLKLGNFTTEDIKQAFIMVAADEIKTEIKNYGRFSPAYLGSVMSAYQVHLNKSLADKKREEDKIALEKEMTWTDEEKKEAADYYFQNNIVNPYVHFKETGQFTIHFYESELAYNELEKRGFIKLSREEKEEIKEIAVIRFKEEQSFEHRDNNFKKSRDIKQIQSWFDSGGIKKYCYTISIEQLFERMKNNNENF